MRTDYEPAFFFFFCFQPNRNLCVRFAMRNAHVNTHASNSLIGKIIEKCKETSKRKKEKENQLFNLFDRWNVLTFFFNQNRSRSV